MRLALLGFAAVLAIGSSHSQPAHAQGCNSGTFDGAFSGEVVVPQNWDCQDRQEFWFTDQGSQIIPYVWFLHLEQADSPEKFAAPANMDRYRYLPQTPTVLNPDALPIGFTRGGTRHNRTYRKVSRQWLGMTCAACHTGQIEYQGAKYLIDGAPTMGDFETLFRDLVTAMKATLADDEKFLRFATAVITDSQVRGVGGTDDIVELRRQLEWLTSIRDAWNERNEGTSDYGHARLDAIGAIFNEVASTGLGVPGNATKADAPVSYPFIWDTPQHDVVQWNGSVKNAGPGALGRNVGEVLGVFGALDLNTVRLSRRGHANSADVAGLARLEGLMWQLESPRWQDTGLPPIDQALADRGRHDFERFCLGCHADIDRDDPARRIKAKMFPVIEPGNPEAVGTDITMAKNFLTKTAEARRLSDRFIRYWGILSEFERFEEDNEEAVPQAQILGYAVIGSITRAFFDNPGETVRALKVGQPPAVVNILESAEERYLDDGEISKRKIRRFLKEIGERLKASEAAPEQPACDLSSNNPVPCYKARPLNGIWATAPYLHNGSVRTMRELLLPASMRSSSFKVGTREFDPDTIGFEDDGAFTLDISLDGNSNAGHEGSLYGSDIFANDEDRLNALLEYLKTL